MQSEQFFITVTSTETSHLIQPDVSFCEQDDAEEQENHFDSE